MASSISTAPAAFEFPREYYFPPFFTRQTNLNTHHAQLVKWSSLVLAYCQHHRIFKLPLSPTTTTTSSSAAPAAAVGGSSNPNATAEDIFFNRRLNRRLALADVREVIDFMRKDGRAEYVGGGEGGAAAAGGGAGGDVVWVYWRTPEEWAALVEGWVDETAQKGTVLTLYELTEGEGTRGTGKLRYDTTSVWLQWERWRRRGAEKQDADLKSIRDRVPWPGSGPITKGSQRTGQEGKGTDIRARGFTGCQVLLNDPLGRDGSQESTHSQHHAAYQA